MNNFFSQIPPDLPSLVWIIGLSIICFATYKIANISGKSKKQSNNMSGNTIKKSKVNQRNNANDKES